MIFINRVDADLMVLKDMDTREGQLKQQVLKITLAHNVKDHI